MSLTQKYLRELLHYDPGAGDFTWLVQRSSRARIDDIAGTLYSNGYVYIQIFGTKYRAHRLAWFYMTGKWPVDQIDHENTIKNDNRWKNLREATNSFNAQNKRKAQRNNITGFLGVSSNGKKFKAKIEINKKRHYLGVRLTPKLAYDEYLKAKRELHPGCTI